MKTARYNRRSPDSSRRRARNSSKSVSASVASGPGSGNANVRLPPERNAAACTRNPGIAKSAKLTPEYHTVPEKEETAMEPETIPAEATAAAPVTAPALVPDVVAEGLVLGNPEALAAQLESFSRARGLFVDWLFNRLVAGIDYMVIHRKVGPRNAKTPCPNATTATGATCPTCGGKSTLCKPGSEKICGLLRLRPRFRRDVETWEMLGSEAGVVALVCELVTAAGIVVAEGRGARHRDQDYGDVNKTIKMVQKSGQTDAVLRLAGLSEIFTQDLEDLPGPVRDDDSGGEFQAPRSKGAAPAAAPQSLEGQLKESVERAKVARSSSAPRPAPRPVSRPQAAPRPAPRSPQGSTAPAPSDALSPARINRLMALLHEAIRSAEVPEEQHEEVFGSARAYLVEWVGRTQGRERLGDCSWRAYDDLCAQVPHAVEAALGGDGPPPRSHPR